MVSNRVKRAENIAEAYRNLKLEPLRTEEEFDAFYVERDRKFYEGSSDLTKRMKSVIELSDSYEKLIVFGFRGCGKSTEVFRFLNSLRGYETLWMSVSELDLYDVDYRDVLVLLLINLVEKAKELGVDIGELENKINELLSVETITESHKKSTEFGFDLSIIKLKLGRESETRRNLRDRLKTRINDLLFYIDKVSIKIEDEVKPLVVAIDDLDKIGVYEQAEKLFYENPMVLTKPNCHIVYTCPISIAFDPRFTGVEHNFDKVFMVPQVPPTDREGNELKEGIEFYRSVFEKRVNPELIEDEALKLAIRNTGKLSEFIQVLRGACLNAYTDESEVIRLDDVNRELIRLSHEFERLLTEEHMEVIKEVYRRKIAMDGRREDRSVRELIFSLIIVEYVYGEDKWYDVNPVLQRALMRRS